MNAREQLFAEMDRFEAALPQLLQTIPDQWVVFKDGQVHSVHETEDAAYWAGIEAFGTHGGQVIVQVAQAEEPVPLTASLLFAVA